MFNMEIGETPESGDEHVDHNKLEEQVKELGQAIAGKANELATYRRSQNSGHE